MLITLEDWEWDKDHPNPEAEKYAWWLANYYKKRYRNAFPHLTSEDLFGMVYLAYVHAKKSWNPEKSKFSNYWLLAAKHTIHSRIQKDFQWSEKVRHFDDLEQEGSRNQETLNDYYLYRVPERDDDWVNALLELFDNDVHKLITALTRNLKPKHLELIDLFYRQELTYREIGERWGKTRQAVEMILKTTVLPNIRKEIYKLEGVARLFGLWDLPSDPVEIYHRGPPWVLRKEQSLIQ